jgi:methylmalonyl-CoA mutase N-terminal domain/subunit
LGWKLLRERLTHEIADHAWKLIEEVEELVE